MAGGKRTILHLVGSPVDDFHAELSRLYAAGCLQALSRLDQFDSRVAYVSPGGSWQFATDLSPIALAEAPRLTTTEAVAVLRESDIDVVLPQMFCMPGMTSYRSLLHALDLPFIGNTAAVMATTANKAEARDIVTAAGVPVPAGRVVHDETRVDLPLPLVVKPVDSDNSVGVTLVRDESQYRPAVREALSHGGRALVESYIELGREVRCGIVVRNGRPLCLPLEEYAVDPATKPIRDRSDKLARTDDGDLFLVAKDTTKAWIVPDDDPVNERVFDLARRAHEALGCRHYSLFDFRIDPDGNPWFLEAGPYCSFAPSSVIAVMAAARGIPVDRLFLDTVTELDREGDPACMSPR